MMREKWRSIERHTQKRRRRIQIQLFLFLVEKTFEVGESDFPA
jgi:hypothetical protein